MLRLVFLDPRGWDYDVATPLERPLGGSQSALCYLAVELARRGHSVTTISGTREPRQVLGVDCRSLEHAPGELFQHCADALVVLNGPAELGPRLRGRLHPQTPLVLWTQHAADQPAMQTLAEAEVREAWDVVVCVSNWHRSSMIKRFNLDESRVDTLRNAISPAFESLFANEAELAAAKSGPPVLAYTSTPFRGLDVLAALFPLVRAEVQEVRLRVYSSMQVYQRDAERDGYAQLYQQCRATPGIEYLGSIPQPQLAQQLRTAGLLAYPCTFAETSCIAVMEALAAGLLVVTTDLGALAETTSGFAVLVPPATNKKNTAEFSRRYSAALARAVRERSQNPAALAAAAWEQVQTIGARSTWRVRAREWEAAVPTWRERRIQGQMESRDKLPHSKENGSPARRTGDP